ncbi:zinc ABC transporter substrate-binding protein [Mangrovicella endophytica]|uniref:zinc ABC transporter substrate-binding protein n=1 Tax=Mangrovicella endophytica TaxID=2066697 RepID=UPI000C9E8023|nr:zinc ABC transporter substrate-binding protein [Mangrovicella endophytica]
MPSLKKLLVLAAASCAMPSMAMAEVPNVVASLKPLHSLLAGVMKGVGEPKLVVQGAGSEHAYSLRPSQAADLEGADLVFWMGPHMETFLTKPLETLAGGATVVALSEVPGATTLPFRVGGPFEAHSHGGEGHHHDESGEAADHDHDREAKTQAGEAHTDHDDGDGDDHEHHADGDHHDDHDHDEHGSVDMHLWLDPENAKVFVRTFETALAKADPEHASAYAANAADVTKQLDQLEAEITKTVQPVKNRPFVVFHDAYQYFEKRFDIPAAGSITVSPETPPGAARVSAIKAKIQGLDAACVFAEPQFEPKLVSVVTEGTNARTGVLDPLGADLTDGPDLYFELLRRLAGSLSDCLGKSPA